MINDLDKEGLGLLRLLVQVLRDAKPSDPNTFVTYTEAHKRLGIPIQFGNPGRSLQAQGLDSLATWTSKRDLPAITGLVVRELERDPGAGYFKANGKKEIDDLPWWLEEMRRAKETDWKTIIGEESPGSLAKTAAGSGNASHPVLTVADVGDAESRFFLKSEYGPISPDWPVVAFTSKHLGSKLQSDFRDDKDFIVYTGTGNDATGDLAHRSRLLSLVRIDTSEILATKDLIAQQSLHWAQQNYPGKWESCFRATEAWRIHHFPSSRDVVPLSFSQMGRHPYRGGVLEITGKDRAALLTLRLARISLTNLEPANSSAHTGAGLDEASLLEEARRIASLIFARVTISGSTVERVAPERTAPNDLVFVIRDLLRVEPLLCYLCGGPMQVRPKNRLLQPSPDRIDSTIGHYGPKTMKLAHMACNFGKNAASVVEFEEWIRVVRQAD